MGKALFVTLMASRGCLCDCRGDDILANEKDTVPMLATTEMIWTAVVLMSGAVGLWVVLAFNRLVRMRNLLKEGWSGVDVQLKRRHDLVPNLVETVRGYSRHEMKTLENVASFRAGAAADRRQTQDRENELTDGLKQLFALAESYPDLKADRSFLDLQKQLVEIEDQLQMARRYYNGTVRNYNILTETFPGNLVAAIFGFRPEEFFQIVTTSEREAPKVSL